MAGKESVMKLCLRKQLSISVLLLVLVVVPRFVAGAEDPWSFLEGFSLVPGSEARVEDHYVAALFEKPEEELLAVVVFNADCDGKNCLVHHRAAYSVFDDKGKNVRRYIDPQERELMKLIFDQPYV
jgi:hypothetical protein